MSELNLYSWKFPNLNSVINYINNWSGVYHRLNICIFSWISFELMKILTTNQVFWRVVVIQHPSTIVEEAHHREQGMLHPNSRHQWGELDWCNLATCRCCISRSNFASCCNRCVTCSRNYRCSGLPAPGTKNTGKQFTKKKD